MAKRKFIDREDVLDTMRELWGTDGELMYAMKSIPTITEQDIVKPYLEKIREELRTEAMEHSGTGEEVIQAYVDGLYEAIKRINNLLSEQGDTDGNVD